MKEPKSTENMNAAGPPVDLTPQILGQLAADRGQIQSMRRRAAEIAAAPPDAMGGFPGTWQQVFAQLASTCDLADSLLSRHTETVCCQQAARTVMENQPAKMVDGASGPAEAGGEAGPETVN